MGTLAHEMLRSDFNSDSVRGMKRWRRADLESSVPNLMREIDRRREGFAGKTPTGKMAVSHLAEAAGLNRRTYYRYLSGEQVPVDEEGVERILAMAQSVGLERDEALAYLPEPLELVEMPSLDGDGPSVSLLHREILAAVKANGEAIEHFEKTVGERLEKIAALLTQSLVGR